MWGRGKYAVCPPGQSRKEGMAGVCRQAYCQPPPPPSSCHAHCSMSQHCIVETLPYDVCHHACYEKEKGRRPGGVRHVFHPPLHTAASISYHTTHICPVPLSQTHHHAMLKWQNGCLSLAEDDGLEQRGEKDPAPKRVQRDSCLFCLLLSGPCSRQVVAVQAGVVVGSGVVESAKCVQACSGCCCCLLFCR